VIRVEAPTGEEFLNEIYAPGRPVIIEGLIGAWPATKRTREVLARATGELDVEV